MAAAGRLACGCEDRICAFVSNVFCPVRRHMVLTTPVARNPDRTRRRLLRAAIKLFAQQGFHAVSVEAIVDLAKVNKRMVYPYFGSKDALFEAALVEV